MSAYTSLNTLAKSLFSALIKDLPEIQYQYRKPGESPDKNVTKTRRPEEHDVDVLMLWQQMWGSTALGFGGIGGAAMTTADVVLVRTYPSTAIYFGGRLAYVIQNPNKTFWEDVAARQMCNVSSAKKRYEQS